jgi:hypothetical protein
MRTRKELQKIMKSRKKLPVDEQLKVYAEIIVDSFRHDEVLGFLSCFNFEGHEFILFFHEMYGKIDDDELVAAIKSYMIPKINPKTNQCTGFTVAMFDADKFLKEVLGGTHDTTIH